MAMSARERKPSGRTNFGDSLNMSPANSARMSSGREGSSTGRVSIDTARVKELNDPLTVHRPYTPEVKQKALVRRPALPKSRYPTIPSPREEKKSGVIKWTKTPMGAQYRKPQICTQEWLNQNTELTWFEAADFRSLLDHDNKRQFARQFVERNRDRMWIYDRKYLKKDPNDVVEEMIDSPSFMNDMVCYDRTEKALGIGQNSDKVYAVMDETRLMIPSKNLMVPDNFASTITTSRSEREERIKKMLLPSTTFYRSEEGSSHRRGYNHSMDFGNFSKWNGILKQSGVGR